MATKKATLVPKVWYAVEIENNPITDAIFCYNTIEDAIDAIDPSDFSKKFYAYKIEPLGELQLTKKIEYKFKK